ncbi:MAG: acyl-ACP--UDP-N-acetylglucosamine O-acyltransferase [Vicinamibacterales bacterium]
MHIAPLLERQRHRFPAVLVDAVSPGDPTRLRAHKTVTVGEDFVQGHFPGVPLLPGVLMLEALVQAATLLLLGRPDTPAAARVELRRAGDVKFRRQVVPGDRLGLDVRLGRCRGPIARVRASADVDGAVVVEATLTLAVVTDEPLIDRTASVHPDAVIGAGTVVGPHAVVGPHVVLGRRVVVGASAVVEGDTTIGDGTQIYPFASVGLQPQDLKYRGERTTVTIGQRNVIRECVTIHRGTVGGGGVTVIGDRNLIMAYAHIAHDCRIGSDTIFGPGATLGGHVTVEDAAQISAYSGVHQFCRVGRHAFIGGYSVVTKDALPFAKTVGNRARVYGLNTVGLVRRGFTPDTVRRLKRAYRYLLTSKLTPSKALDLIEADPAIAGPEVAYLVQFVRGSARGVTLKRPTRRGDGGDAEDEA